MSFLRFLACNSEFFRNVCIVRGNGGRLRRAISGLPVSSNPRVLQRLPRRDPPRRIHASHLADEISELRVHLLPPPKRQPRVLLAESTEEVLETLDERVIVSSVISNQALKIIHLASEERQVAPEYQLCLLLWGSTVRLVREEHHPPCPCENCLSACQSAIVYCVYCSQKDSPRWQRSRCLMVCSEFPEPKPPGFSRSGCPTSDL